MQVLNNTAGKRFSPSLDRKILTPHQQTLRILTSIMKKGAQTNCMQEIRSYTTEEIEQIR